MEKKYNIDFADGVYNDLAEIPAKVGSAILDNPANRVRNR
jgi:hypothetical protein